MLLLLLAANRTRILRVDQTMNLSTEAAMQTGLTSTACSRIAVTDQAGKLLLLVHIIPLLIMIRMFKAAGVPLAGATMVVGVTTERLLHVVMTLLIYVLMVAMKMAALLLMAVLPMATVMQSPVGATTI